MRSPHIPGEAYFYSSEDGDKFIECLTSDGEYEFKYGKKKGVKFTFDEVVNFVYRTQVELYKEMLIEAMDNLKSINPIILNALEQFLQALQKEYRPVEHHFDDEDDDEYYDDDEDYDED